MAEAEARKLIDEILSSAVEKAIVTWIDEEVKKFRFRNRSHGFEYAVANLMKEEKKE